MACRSSLILGTESACWEGLVGNIGILGLYWGYTGIMEKKMETTMVIIVVGFHSICLQTRALAFAFVSDVIVLPAAKFYPSFKTEGSAMRLPVGRIAYCLIMSFLTLILCGQRQSRGASGHQTPAASSIAV